jgi:O-antigen/teichoic acid export membrane protein
MDGRAGGLLAVAVWTATPYVLQLLGDDYADLVAPTRLLTVILLLAALNLPFGYALLGTGRHRDWSLGQISAAGANIGLNLLLVPIFGWRAAAGVAVVSYCWLTAYYIQRVVRDPAVIISRGTGKRRG